jgi:hypothetical protein
MGDPARVNKEVAVGSHRVLHEVDGVALIHFGADPTEAEMERIMGALIRMCGTAPTFILIDFSAVSTLSPEVRKVVGRRSQELDVRGIGMFGATFHMRVIAKLVNGAIAMFKKDPVPQAFFKTREEADRWIEDLHAHAEGGAS